VPKLRSVVSLVGLGLALSGCDWLKKDVLELPPPHPPRHPKHDLVIKDGKGYYNGTFIGPGVHVAEWKRLFGAPSTDGSSLAAWTNLGLRALLARKPGQAPGTVSSFEVAVEVFPAADPHDFKRAFPGRVLLDEAPLYKGVKMVHVNQFFRNEACEPPGGGVRFGESALPGHYECSTPAYTYWLDIYQERRSEFVRRLAIDPK
jgi:hypothetical protein